MDCRETCNKKSAKSYICFLSKNGQGQFGRIWHSPKGGIWVSAAIKREGVMQNNSELYGLAVALALVERIERDRG